MLKQKISYIDEYYSSNALKYHLFIISQLKLYAILYPLLKDHDINIFNLMMSYHILFKKI